MRARRPTQRGFFLIEALVAILIFSIGILGMVAIAGTAMGSQTESRMRTDAATLAEELATAIVLNADRSNLLNFTNSLNSYAHQPLGGNCAFAGPPAPAANAIMQAWLTRVTAQGPALPGLPGATAATQQVTVDTSATGFNRVQITVCWRAPTDDAMRQHVFVTYVNGLL